MTHAQIAQLTTLDRLDAQAAYFEDGESISVRVPRSAYERMGSPTTVQVLLTPMAPAAPTEAPDWAAVNRALNAWELAEHGPSGPFSRGLHLTAYLASGGTLEEYGLPSEQQTEVADPFGLVQHRQPVADVQDVPGSTVYDLTPHRRPVANPGQCDMALEAPDREPLGCILHASHRTVEKSTHLDEHGHRWITNYERELSRRERREAGL